MASASSWIAARTISETLRLWPRCTTSAPCASRRRRIMMIAASWPSNREAAETKRSGGLAGSCSGTAPLLRPTFMGSTRLGARSPLKGVTLRTSKMATGEYDGSDLAGSICAAAGLCRSRYNTPTRESSTAMANRRAVSPAEVKQSALPASPWRASRERVREREVKREAVIRAAAHAFNRKGYHNTSLDDIAAALDVTKPTVYYYVTSKEQLLFECFVAGVEQIRAGFREVRDQDIPARERLQAVLRHYAKTIASEFGWVMVRVEEQDLTPDMSSLIKAMKSEIDQGIRKLIRDGIQDGFIHQCDPKMTAFALAGSLNWIAHWYRENRSLLVAVFAVVFFSVFVFGLLFQRSAC